MYSNIEKWQVKNFRNIGDVSIDFTKSPIVTLVGDNEAGKTSIVKSFAVLGANGYESDQKSYIRDGSRGFGIAASLVDGTKVVRIKTAGTNSFTIEDGDGNIVYKTDKIDRGYGVPVEIAKVMGLLIEPETKELLQVRTYEDQLLFVLTKGSENYKVMYNALKVDNLTRAIANGNKQANADKQTISNCEVAIQTLREAIKDIKITDISNLIKVRNILKAQYTKVSELQKVINLLNRNEEIENELGSLKDLNETSEINYGLAYKLNQVNNVLKNKNICEDRYNRVSDIEKISALDTESVAKFIRAESLIEENNLAKSKYETYKDVESLSEIDYLTFNGLIDIINRIKKSEDLENKLAQNTIDASVNMIDTNRASRVEDVVTRVNSMINSIGNYEAEIVKIEAEAKDWYNKIKESGALVTNCPRCGETVVIEQV